MNNNDSLVYIFLNTTLINNFVLSMFLGICPFLGVSGKMDTATRMGVAVTFVLIVCSICTYGINYVTGPEMIDAPYLRLICYIAVIASAVQLVEMTMKKFSPGLFKALGIYLPLITTNCCILAVALLQTSKGYNFVQCLVYSVGVGLGFTLSLAIMASVREQLDLADVPDVVRGSALTLVVAGILSLAFMGFGGLGG